MLGWEKVRLITGVKIVGAATLNDLALDAGQQCGFKGWLWKEFT